LGWGSAEIRTRDVPEVDELSGSVYQETLLVELAVGADHGDLSQDIWGILFPCSASAA
jgi:hypothetical protein